jgi:hypothetical protein
MLPPKNSACHVHRSPVMSTLVMKTHTTANAAYPHLYKLIEVVADQLSQMQYDGHLPVTNAFNDVVSDLYVAAMDLHAAETELHVQAIERNQLAS